MKEVDLVRIIPSILKKIMEIRRIEQNGPTQPALQQNPLPSYHPLAKTRNRLEAILRVSEISTFTE